MNNTNIVTDEIYASYKLEPVGLKAFDGKTNEFLFERADGDLYDAFCTNCGTQFQYRWNFWDETSAIQCPCCGNAKAKVEHKELTGEKHVCAIRYDNTDLPDNSLAVRIYSIKMCHPKTKVYYADSTCKYADGEWIRRRKSESAGHIKGFSRTATLFLSDRHVVYWGGAKCVGEAVKQLLRSVCNAPTVCQQSQEEIKAVLEKSYFKDSNAVAAMGLYPDKPGVVPSHSLSYLLGWMENKNLACLYDEGFYELVKTYASLDADKLNGATAQEVLKLSDASFAVAKGVNPNLWDIETIQKMSHDATLTAEGYVKMMHREWKHSEQKDTYRQKVLLLMEQGVSFDAILPYVESQLALCAIISARELTDIDILDLWISYLRAAQALGYDMASHAVLYPEDVEEAQFLANRKLRRQYL